MLYRPHYDAEVIFDCESPLLQYFLFFFTLILPLLCPSFLLSFLFSLLFTSIFLASSTLLPLSFLSFRPLFSSYLTAVGMYPHVKQAVENGEVLLEWDYSKGEREWGREEERGQGRRERRGEEMPRGGAIIRFPYNFFTEHAFDHISQAHSQSTYQCILRINYIIKCFLSIL
jgi:hypothetical protein